MKVIKPTFVPVENDTYFLSSLVQDEGTIWSNLLNYAVGAIVVHANKVWESVQASAGIEPGTDALYWSEVSSSNRWAMFDTQVSSQTTAQDAITVVLKFSNVSGLGLFNLIGEQVSIRITNGPGGIEIYDYTQSLDGSVIDDWYAYFFEPFTQLGEVVLTDLPPYYDAWATIVISNLTPGNPVACGILTAGTVYNLGDTQLGATAGIIDYSRKETSASGLTTFVQRKYSKRMSARMLIDNAAMNRTQRVLADVRATPCAWIGVDGPGYEPLMVYGFYRDFSIDVAYPMQSYCNLEIEGLI